MNGLEVANLIKYYLQFKNPKIINHIPLARIRGNAYYKNNKEYFDKVSSYFERNKIDIKKYIKFYFCTLKKFEKDVLVDFYSKRCLVEYQDYLISNYNYKKYYKYFLKTAKFIALESIKMGFLSCKDYIKYLIDNKKLSQYYITGKISKYYLSAIPKFKLIIPKLDHFSKNDLMDIYKNFDVYNAKINSAFNQIKTEKLNPIKFTDNLIFSIKNGI